MLTIHAREHLSIYPFVEVAYLSRYEEMVLPICNTDHKPKIKSDDGGTDSRWKEAKSGRHLRRKDILMVFE